MEKTGHRWDIYPDDSLLGNVLAVPGDLVSLSLIASRVLRFRDGHIEVEQFVREGGYTVFTETSGGETAMQQPARPGREFLEVPREIEPVLNGIVDELGLAMCTTDAERFQKLQEYFDQNFEYSLDWQGPKSEPVRERSARRRPLRRPPPGADRGVARRPGVRMGMRVAGRLAEGAVERRGTQPVPPVVATE